MNPDEKEIFLLDIDHISVLQRDGADSDALRERLKSVDPDDYGVTIVTYREQAEGRIAEITKARTPEAEIAAFSSGVPAWRFVRSVR